MYMKQEMRKENRGMKSSDYKKEKSVEDEFFPYQVGEAWVSTSFAVYCFGRLFPNKIYRL